MTALAAARVVQQYGVDEVFPVLHSYPIADNVKIYPGALIALSGGFAQPATSATGLNIAGIYDGGDILDNTVVGHAASAFNVSVRSGCFAFQNGDTSSIAAANVGQAAYAVDDQTVALTDANGTRSIAGLIESVDASGKVFVTVNPRTITSSSTPMDVITFFIPALSAIANAGVLARFTPKFAGRILAIGFSVATAVTTAAKAATLAPSIAGTPVTGGLLALTSANCTPIGAAVAGSAITALDTFTAGQEITIVASSVTAFVEGAGTLVIQFA